MQKAALPVASCEASKLLTNSFYTAPSKPITQHYTLAPKQVRGDI